MYLLADLERRVMAYKLACTIRLASWLGKHAANGRSRVLAYDVKAEKLSTALLSFADHFRLLQAERHPHYGVLILVALPNGFSAHVPLGSLTMEAQARVQRRVVAMLEATADDRSRHYESLPLAA